MIKELVVHHSKIGLISGVNVWSNLVGARNSPNGGYGISTADRPQSALIPVNLTTLPHFSVSSAISLPKSTGEPASTVPPRSASRVFMLGSARPCACLVIGHELIH